MTFWNQVWATTIGFSIGKIAADTLEAIVVRAWHWNRERRWRKAMGLHPGEGIGQVAQGALAGKIFTGLKGGR